jgi:hypothetical protein
MKASEKHLKAFERGINTGDKTRNINRNEKN